MTEELHTKICKKLRPRKGLHSNPFMRGNDFLAKLKAQPTLADKRSQIVEANPLLLIFADNIKTEKNHG